MVPRRAVVFDMVAALRPGLPVGEPRWSGSVLFGFVDGHNDPASVPFDGARPPTIRSLDAGGGQVVYCGSFSKTLAPALRVGYIVADWPLMSRLLALKTDVIERGVAALAGVVRSAAC